MGIKKLAKYISSNYHDWENTSLEDCPVVLDGNGLPYYLSKRADLKWKFGGQYPALVNLFESFFDALRKKNVCPIHIVFDGIDPVEKLETLRQRKQGFQETIIKAIEGEEAYGHQDILPPLVSETFRKFLHDYNAAHGILKIYSGDEEADSLGIVIANKYNCPLLGNDSDYFMAALRKGYICYADLKWTVPGEPVRGKVFHRDSFARSLGIDSDLVIAIPAIVGNDSIPNLVDETSLKRVRDNPRYRGNDTEKGIIFICRQRTMRALEDDLQSRDGSRVLNMFRDNLRKARETYEAARSFDEREFRMVCSYKTKTDEQYPAWIIEQYRDFKFSKNFFEILLKGVYFHRVVPDDYHQESCKIFSHPIRQEMYGIMEVQGSVREVIRVSKELGVQEVRPKQSELSIFRMHAVPQDERIRKLCSVLMCDPSTLQSLDREWYIPVASVCYWSKTAGITRNHLKLRALLLCIAECYLKEPTSFEPVFNLQNLHTLTQWQCTYHDSILFNHILALPLPYLSPARLFDGKRASYYYQQDERFLEQRLAKLGREIRGLYDQLLEAVQRNI